MLKFLGRGSAFADEQNCAYLQQGDTLILLDCPMSAFHRLKRAAVMQNIKQIDILVTHTHSDHAGGIPMLIHFAYFVLGVPVRVIAPDDVVAADLQFLICRLDGCAAKAYDITIPDKYKPEWLAASVPTVHAPQLPRRCFGWHLRVNETDIIYTGDTASLKPFLPLLHPGAYFYTEASVFRSNVHLYLDDVLPVLEQFCADGVHVYLMHLDDETAVLSRIRNTGILLAPLVP